MLPKTIDEPLEPGGTKVVKPPATPDFSLLKEIAEGLISIYQREISPHSISRCPFSISCSAFAKQAIDRYGLLGLAKFIDRYYYRENREALVHYRLVEKSQGILKLDDSFFLSPNTP